MPGSTGRSHLMAAAKHLYWAVMNSLPDELAVELQYFRVFKKFPDLENPQTFSEKVNWRKIHQRNPLFADLTDKIAAKDRVAALIGIEHITPTLWVGERPEDIPFDRLEPPYVIKVNHCSGGGIFVRTASDVAPQKIFKSIGQQLRRSYGDRWREWGYHGIPRKVFVERMIVTANGGVPDDYKLFVYHGRVRFIQVDTDRFKDHKRSIFDRDWQKLPVKFVYPTIRTDWGRPEHLETMIMLAERIGALFDFVRVDFYNLPETVLFGEATFYPEGGLGKFVPAMWDLHFGEPWRLPA